MWFKASHRSMKTTNPPISVGGVVLQVTEKQKYLGLIFDSTMSWSHHGVLGGVVSFVLLCNSLGSIFGKYLIKEASTYAESCSAAMLWTKEMQSCD